MPLNDVRSVDAGPQPSNFVGVDLRGAFGMAEYEAGIAAILTYLADDTARINPAAYLAGMSWPALDVLGWQKLFRVDTIPTIHPALFAMMCADGWIEASHFPKYTFRLSRDAIGRLHERVSAAEGTDESDLRTES
jgi:hypothetical protein